MNGDKDHTGKGIVLHSAVHIAASWLEENAHER
jgi:hypothetical protein